MREKNENAEGRERRAPWLGLLQHLLKGFLIEPICAEDENHRLLEPKEPKRSLHLRPLLVTGEPAGGRRFAAITQPVSSRARASTAQCSPLGFKQVSVELVLVTKG